MEGFRRDSHIFNARIATCNTCIKFHCSYSYSYSALVDTQKVKMIILAIQLDNKQLHDYMNKVNNCGVTYPLGIIKYSDNIQLNHMHMHTVPVQFMNSIHVYAASYLYRLLLTSNFRSCSQLAVVMLSNMHRHVSSIAVWLQQDSRAITQL